MKAHRIQALFLRHLYPLRRDFDILSDMIYWPIVDAILWGVTGEWLAESSNFSTLLVSFMTALVLWNIIWRSQAEVGRNLIDEIWNYNLTNLFSTPLKLSEWISSVILLSFVKVTITLVVLVPIIFFLYEVNVFRLGWWLLVFFASTAMTGWWMGFLSSSVVIRYGAKMQTVVWTFPGALLPFSAVYFPLEKLPFISRVIAQAIPTTYIFESMRSLIATGTVDVRLIYISFGLNILYLICSIAIFIRNFEYSKKLGFNRFG